MDEQTYIITFDNTSAADANRYAEELRHALLDASPDVEVHRRRDDSHTQDFGSTLVLPRDAQRGCCRATVDLRSERSSGPNAQRQSIGRTSRMERKQGRGELEGRTTQGKRP